MRKKANPRDLPFFFGCFLLGITNGLGFTPPVTIKASISFTNRAYSFNEEGAFDNTHEEISFSRSNSRVGDSDGIVREGFQRSGVHELDH